MMKQIVQIKKNNLIDVHSVKSHLFFSLFVRLLLPIRTSSHTHTHRHTRSHICTILQLSIFSLAFMRNFISIFCLFCKYTYNFPPFQFTSCWFQFKLFCRSLILLFLEAVVVVVAGTILCCYSKRSRLPYSRHSLVLSRKFRFKHFRMYLPYICNAISESMLG